MLTKKRIPIGYEDFKRVIDGNFYYVDKTMLIRDIINKGGQTTLITRPRRFGKTLNFSMLKYFFGIEEKDSAYIFDGLKISEYYDELKEYRNAYPVISLSMKSGKQSTYELALDSLCDEIRLQYDKYNFIIDSDRLTDKDRAVFRSVWEYDVANEKDFKASLKNLSVLLKKYYGRNAVILIDEYDVPLENAYFMGFYDKMIGFIRSLFESSLKTNDALEFAVITGCLRISKESIFTGLNNLQMNSILSDDFSEHFGFEQIEVDELLEYYELEEKREEIAKWYDGYIFGRTEVYNPWSVIYQVKEWCARSDLAAKAWWINTSSNAIIKSLIERSDEDKKNIVEELINGGYVQSFLDETITYGDMDAASENIWNFLFFTGYLKAIDSISVDGKDYYTLVIPNLEIRQCYTDVIRKYFERFKNQVDRKALYNALLNHDADGFAKQLNVLLEKSMSYYDNAENFFHGLVMGLLSYNHYYRVESNRETGSGRCDLILYQEYDNEIAIILELKVCKENERLKAKAAEALNQINEKDYAAQPRALGYTDIIKYGVAFKKKLCCAVTEEN